MFVIVHSGQTGVERGAHEGAMAAGFKVAGYMAANGRDELGPVPSRISAHLTPALDGGPRAAIKANLALANAVMLVVPDADAAERFPAMDWVVRDSRALRLPMLICDRDTSVAQAAVWGATARANRAEFRLLVTGPRATRWSAGEQVARRLIRGLGILPT